MRFNEDTIAALIDIAWWDWNIADIVANESAIVGADLDTLKHIAGRS
jgi:virginiamycin A acetyltransferase